MYRLPQNIFIQLLPFIISTKLGKYNHSVIKNLFSPFFCVMFFVAARKPTAERNKTYFTLYALNLPPLNSRVKNKTGFEFLFYYRFDSANQKQNIEENIVQVWFYETSIKILRLISKAPPSFLLICRQNSNVDFVKPIP